MATNARRRHHIARLKKKRRFYWGWDEVTDPRRLGKIMRTPNACSCWMCNKPRKRFGLPPKELTAAQHLAQEEKLYEPIPPTE